MKKTINSLSAFFAILSFLAMLGTAGGLENNMITISETIMYFLISLFSFMLFSCVCKFTEEK